MRSFIVSVLMLFFFFSNAQTSPKYIIKRPVAGDTLIGCTPTTVSVLSRYWYSSFQRLYYSIDDGVTWKNANAGVTVANGMNSHFEWTPPNINLDKLKLRMGTGFNEIADSSFVVKSKAPKNTLLKPNGNELWGTRSTQKIEWTTNDTSSFVTLLYRLNNDANWYTVVKTSDNGAYDWTLPSNIGDEYMFQIMDEDGCTTDESDTTFEVYGVPYIAANNYNYMETYAGSGLMIKWSSEYLLTDSVNLDFSLDSGRTWINLETNLQNTGRYGWSIPDTINSKYCFIKVSESKDPDIYDNTMPFSIYPSQVFMTLDGDPDKIAPCTNYDIRLNSYGNISNSSTYDVYYSIDSGVNWNLTKQRASGVFTWTTPASTSNNSFLKAIHTQDSSIQKVSRKLAIQRDSSELHLIEENVYGTGDEVSIKINTNISKWKRFNLSTNGGKDWEFMKSISSHEDSLYWLVPNIISDSCKIAVYINDCHSDTTDGFFSIQAKPNIRLTTYIGRTSGGYNYYRDTPSNAKIEWDTYHGSGQVNIDYSLDSGQTWINKESNYVDTGLYYFPLPHIDADYFSIRVTDSEFNSASEELNSHLILKKSYINFDSSMAGQNLSICSQYNIPFESDGGAVTEAYLSLDSGLTWALLEDDGSSRLGKVTLPDVSSEKCFFRLSNGLITNISPMFSIKNLFKLTSPNGGEYINKHGYAGSLQVDWEWPNKQTYNNNNVDIFLSRDSGDTWTAVAENHSGNGSYKAPYGISGDRTTKAQISIVASNNSCLTDTSDNFFAITTIDNDERIELENISGDNYWARQIKELKITHQFTYSNCVNVDISYDYGISWERIDSNIALSDTSDFTYYTFEAPKVYSSDCRLRIQECGNAKIENESRRFSINPGRYYLSGIDSTSSLDGCTESTLRWGGLGYSSNATLFYSTNNQARWDTLKTYNTIIKGTKYLDWLPPQVTSDSCYIKIQSNFYSEDTIIVGPFSITKKPLLVELIEPNAASVLVSGENNTFKWNKTENVSGVICYLYDSNNKLVTSSGLGSGTTNLLFIPPYMGSHASIVLTNNQGCASDTVANIQLKNDPYIRTSFANHTTFYQNEIKKIEFESGNLPIGSNRIVDIDYSLDDGGTWFFIESTSKSEFNWEVPNTTSNNCKFRLRSKGTNDSFIEYSNIFRISERTLHIISPDTVNGISSCNDEKLMWYLGYPENEIVTVNLYYSINNGANWTTIITDYNNPQHQNLYTQKYVWDIPNVDSDSCLMKIEDAQNTSINNISDLFSITSLSIEAPYFVEDSIFITDSVTVKWDSSPNIKEVQILWRSYTTSQWRGISGGLIPNTGEFKWYVSRFNAVGDRNQIKVVNANSDCDELNTTYFNIHDKPFLQLRTGNNVEHILADDSLQISWTTNLINSDSLKLEYSEDDGQTWIFIENVTNKLSTNSYYGRTNSISWFVDGSKLGKELLFKISDIESLKTYTSNYPYEVVSNYGKINYPEEGDHFDPNSYSWTSWEILEKDGTPFYIELSVDGGNSWDLIYTENNGQERGEWEWETPNVNSNECIMRIRIEDYTSESGMFTIGSPVSVSSVNNNNTSYLYPNPTSENVFLKGFVNVVSVNIITVNGDLLQTINGNVKEVNFEKYPPGVYFLRINTKNIVENKRVTKIN